MTTTVPLRVVVMLLVLLTAACGADGAPTAPGVKTGGNAQLGVLGS